MDQPLLGYLAPASVHMCPPACEKWKEIAKKITWLSIERLYVPRELRHIPNCSNAFETSGNFEWVFFPQSLIKLVRKYSFYQTQFSQGFPNSPSMPHFSIHSMTLKQYFHVQLVPLFLSPAFSLVSTFMFFSLIKHPNSFHNIISKGQALLISAYSSR